MPQISGVNLTDKEAGFHGQLKVRNPAFAKKFLDGIRKKQVAAKAAHEDIVEICRREASPPELIGALDNRGIHNFSMGCLDSYFYLQKFLNKGKAFLWRGRALIVASRTGGFKTFVYQHAPEDRAALGLLQRLGAVYSISEIPGLEKESKFKEMAYDLDRVFDPASYPNAKKRHNRIKYPFIWLDKIGARMEVLAAEHFDAVAALHERWVARKLADPKTFQMMFPRKRYLYCCEKALKRVPAFPGPQYRAWVWRLEGALVAVRVVSVERGGGYDLANFGAFWSTPSNFMNMINVQVLGMLHDAGVKTFNCGASLNKTLTQFKNHYPNDHVVSAMYSRVA